MTRMAEPSPAQPSRRRFCLGAAALLLAGPGAGVAAEPEVRDVDWTDAARGRPVPVRLYVPEGAGTTPVPLVVFSHGIGGSRMGYGYLGRHWASAGIASLHVQHVGSDRQLWRGNPLGLVDRLQGAAQPGEALARVRDVGFALDAVLAGEAGVRIDPQRIVAAGHSYGANTTMLLAGARAEVDGQALDLRDPRVRAAVLISAPPFYGASDTGRILAPLTVPSLHVTCTEDVIRIPGYGSGLADRLAVFEATGSARKWLAVFAGGSHSLFTGRLDERSPLLVATRELAVAFVREVMLGEAEAIERWSRSHGPQLDRFVARTPAALPRG